MTFENITKSGCLALLFVTVSALVQPAFAQTAEAPAVAGEIPKNNWSVNCSAGETAEAPLVCQMMQNVVVAQSNQRLLTVIIRPQPDSANHTLTLALPHGVDFPKGVEAVIDDKEPFNIPVQTSNSQGAFSNLPINDELLAQLKSGSSVKFSFHSVSGQTFAVPISLIGFSTAYEKLAAG